MFCDFFLFISICIISFIIYHLPTTHIAIRIASASTNINAAATKCATRAIATRSTGGASRLIIAISPAISIAASRASIVILALVIIVAAFTRSLTAFAAVFRVILRTDVGITSRALLLTSNDVVLVNALSTEDVAAGIECLWEDALADSGLTELALEADLIQLEVVPQIGLCWIWVYKDRLLSEGVCSEGRGCVCFCLFWCRQWLSPVDGDVCFGWHSTLGISSSHFVLESWKSWKGLELRSKLLRTRSWGT